MTDGDVGQIAGELTCRFHALAEIDADHPPRPKTRSGNAEATHAASGVQHKLSVEETRVEWSYPVQELGLDARLVLVDVLELLPLPAKRLGGTLFVHIDNRARHARDAPDNLIRGTAPSTGKGASFEVLVRADLRSRPERLPACRTDEIVKQPGSHPVCFSFFI